MNCRCFLLPAVLAVIGGRSAFGGAPLAVDSPFIPPGAVGVATAAPSPFELQGIMTTPQGILFSIFDPAKKSAQWLGLHETGTGFRVLDYRVVNDVDEVVIDIRGDTRVLRLKRAKVLASKSVVGGNGTPTLGNAAGGSPTVLGVAEDELLPGEKARLQQLAAQVRVRLSRQRRDNEKPDAPAAP